MRRDQLSVNFVIKGKELIFIICNISTKFYYNYIFHLENGSDVHVNERQKIRHYRGRSTGEEE